MSLSWRDKVFLDEYQKGRTLEEYFEMRKRLESNRGCEL